MKNNNKNTANAFFIGIAIGSLAALFLAPFSGKKLRRVSKQKGQETIDKAKQQLQTIEPQIKDVADKGRELTEKGKRWWEKAINSTENKTQDMEADAKHEIEQAGDVIEEKTDEL